LPFPPQAGEKVNILALDTPAPPEPPVAPTLAAGPPTPPPGRAALAEEAPLRGAGFWVLFSRQPRAMVGAGIVLVLVLVAVLAGVLSPYPPNLVLTNGLSVTGAPIAPEFHMPFILGTDQIGRDELSRLLYGSRTSLLVGTLSTGAALVAGTVVGIVSGYYGGVVETVLMRVVDVIMSLPLLLAVILLASLMRPSVLTVVGAIAFFTWPVLARVARSQTLEVVRRPYVDAARALGARDIGILVRHVLPAVFPVAITYSTLQVATNILTAASLSFLGIGVPPPAADWGAMTAQGLGYYQVAPWLVVLPGTALALTTLGFNYLGDGLRLAVDPMGHHRAR
jgi:peptide/nickel transport system permease protein